MQGDMISIRRFEWLLTQRQYPYLPEDRVFEKIPDRGKKPDFYVSPPGQPNFLAEVESFEKPTVLDTMESRTLSVGHMELQKRVNRRVQWDNPSAARKLRMRVEHSLRRLSRYPESGRLIPEFPDLPYREVIVAPYRFFYRIEGKVHWIVAVWHGAQLPEETYSFDR